MFNPAKRLCRFSVRRFSQETLQLQVKDPAFLLTHIASHYRHLSKIIAEFVDNSLDDAEKLAEQGEDGRYRYQRPVKIDIRLTPVKDESFAMVDIVDNCFGMSDEELSGLVNSIGQSKKRRDTNTNGYFGFGVNSFRACSQMLVVRTKHESGQYRMNIAKDDTAINSPAPYRDDPKSLISNFDTGTHVTLFGVARPYTVQMRHPDRLRKDLGQHFWHHLVNRDNLEITITDWEEGSERVTLLKAQMPPIQDEHWLPKEEFTLTKFDSFVVEVGVLPNDYYSYPEVAVVSRGREIQKLNELESFKSAKTDWKRKHANKENIWDKPQVKGYIDVRNSVEQVISRNEFKETLRLEALYDKLLRYGSTKKVLEKVNNIIGESNDSKMGRLSHFMAHIVDKRELFEKARKRLAGNEVAEYGGEKAIDKSLKKEMIKEKELLDDNIAAKAMDADSSKQKREYQNKGKHLLQSYRGAYPIEFENAGVTELRARMEGKTTIINEDHPDAQNELYRGSAELKIDRRTFGYLARQVSNTFLIREIAHVEKENIAEYINEVQNLEVEIRRSFEKHYRVGMFDEENADEKEPNAVV